MMRVLRLGVRQFCTMLAMISCLERFTLAVFSCFRTIGKFVPLSHCSLLYGGVYCRAIFNTAFLNVFVRCLNDLFNFFERWFSSKRSFLCCVLGDEATVKFMLRITLSR
jgi:hypothetical protein